MHLISIFTYFLDRGSGQAMYSLGFLLASRAINMYSLLTSTSNQDDAMPSSKDTSE